MPAQSYYPLDLLKIPNRVWIAEIFGNVISHTKLQDGIKL